MKKYLLLVFLFYSVDFSFGQSSWFPTGATWINRTGSFAVLGYIRYQVTGDTVINLISCKKLSTQKVLVNYLFYTVDTTYGQVFAYESDKVIFGSYDGVSDFDTLYNFNAAPGDKWGLATYACGNPDATVEVTDTGTIIIANQHLKRIIIQYHQTSYNASTDTLIEKIGSTSFGLFEKDMCVIDGGEAFCSYEDNDIGLFPAAATSCDTLYLATVDPKPVEAFSIFPNPAQDVLQLSGDLFEGKTGQLEIFDAIGRSILKLDKIPDAINVSAFSNGIYVLEVKTESQITFRKFLKK